jgi:quinol monooxygenase YgiN
MPDMSYVLVARWRAKSGSEDRVLAVLEELTAASRAEPGCLGYTPHRSTEDPLDFLIYEVYADEAAFEAHSDSEHFRRLVLDEAVPKLLEARDRAFFVPVVEA